MRKIELYVRWIGIPIVAFLPYFLAKHPDDIYYSFWEQYFISLVFTTVIWNGCVMIFRFFRKKYPGIQFTVRRLVFVTSTLMLYILIVIPIIRLSLGLVTWQEVINFPDLFHFLPVTVMISLFVGSIYEGVYFFEQWKTAVQQNEALKNQQVRTQFEVLQNQMSPHFLFNSLNTLTTLIAENQENAIEFTQKLSEVYRYILQNKERELVTLDEELDFVKSYVFLLQMRYPENLEVQFNVNMGISDAFVPPLTLQILIENAIKHNAITKNKPLKVEIQATSSDQITVTNNLQERSVPEKSTKTGLSNIQKRYDFFGNKNIEIVKSEAHFTVFVPLIKLVREADHVMAESL
jgi:sensor histidine kinase YesM